MSIKLITGPANAGKAQVVLDALRAHLARGEEPLLVVPTRADVQHYRRELAGDGALMGARIERFSGLVEEVLARAAATAPALGAVARERLLADAAQRALADATQGARSSPAISGLASAAGDLVAELRVRRVSPARLNGALARWAPPRSGAPARRLGELYQRYDEAVQGLGCVDQHQRVIEALDLLRRTPALWRATPVLVYGFDDFDRLQLDVIETLGNVLDAPLTVSLTFERGRAAFAGRASTHEALAPLAAERVELPALATYYGPEARAALSHLERSLFEREPARVDPGGWVRLLEGTSERAELELVAREIRALLEDGLAPEEIAVVLRLDASSADLLESVFSAAAVPYALQRLRSLSDTATGAALIGLLRSLTPEGELGDLLRWLRAPGLLARPELADALEASARRTGALGATAARELWERRHWRLDALEQMRAAAQRGPAALIERAGRELQWLFCRPRRGAAALLEADELDEASALRTGTRALAELAALARREPSLAPADPGELAHVLERQPLFSGESPRAGAVAVLDPLALRARRVSALFLGRLQEGLFPATAPQRALLGEEERRDLARASGLRLGSHVDGPAAERYLFYAAVSRPRQLLVLSWHTADEDGAPRGRSLFVDDVCDLFDRRLTARRAGPRTPPGELANGRARSLDAATAARRGATDLPRELVDEQLLHSLASRVWSASSLELWLRCPVRWFVERMLSARDLEAEPEPLARGGLAHAALRDTLAGLREEVGSARLKGDTIELACRLLERALARHEPDYPLSLAPERQPGARRRLRADLERYLRHEARRAEEVAANGASGERGPFEPRHLELEFGFDAEDESREQDGHGPRLAALQLGEGVRLRGRIDRVDVGAGGAAVVYDYKGSRVTPGARWLSEGVVQVALYMTAVEQLLGLRAVGGLYQPLSGSDLRPRGALDGDRAAGFNAYRTDLFTGAELGELVQGAVALTLDTAQQAARGLLRARPQSCAFRGGGCAYPSICRCARR
jgi:ATP-dependent helicase/nuclease subunit B